VPSATDKIDHGTGNDCPECRAHKGNDGPFHLLATILQIVTGIAVQTKRITHNFVAEGDEYIDPGTERKQGGNHRGSHREVGRGLGLATAPKELEKDHSNDADQPGNPPDPRDTNGDYRHHHGRNHPCVVVWQTHATRALDSAARFEFLEVLGVVIVSLAAAHGGMFLSQ